MNGTSFLLSSVARSTDGENIMGGSQVFIASCSCQGNISIGDCLALAGVGCRKVPLSLHTMPQ